MQVLMLVLVAMAVAITMVVVRMILNERRARQTARQQTQSQPVETPTPGPAPEAPAGPARIGFLSFRCPTKTDVLIEGVEVRDGITDHEWELESGKTYKVKFMRGGENLDSIEVKIATGQRAKLGCP